MIKNRFGALEPCPEFDDDYANINPGETVWNKITKKRNIRFHRKFMALCRVAFDNQDIYDNFDIFYKVLVVESGYCQLVKVGIKIIFIADSLKFSQCDELKFRKIYDAVLGVILKKYCKGSTAEEINARVDQILSFAA